MDVCESILACFGSATSAHKTDANMQSNIALFASDKPLCLKASVTGRFETYMHTLRHVYLHTCIDRQTGDRQTDRQKGM